MKSHGNVRRILPWPGVLARCLLMVSLVFATFNPSYYSISTWLLSDSSMPSVKALVAFGLALTWLIVLRISLAGLGWLGLVYIGLSLLILALIEARFGFLRFLSTFGATLFVELGLAVALAFGLVFPYWVRQASGQSAVVKRPP
jgi:hypothetical protein